MRRLAPVILLATVPLLLLAPVSADDDTPAGRALLIDGVAMGVPVGCADTNSCAEDCQQAVGTVMAGDNDINKRVCETSCITDDAGLLPGVRRGLAGKYVLECKKRVKKNKDCAAQLAKAAVCIGYTPPTADKAKECVEEFVKGTCRDLEL